MRNMKNYFTIFIMVVMLAVTIPALSGTTLAQTRYYGNGGRTYLQRKPSLYRRHRNLINIAIGTGGGAVIGGLLGGRRGAGIGALIGAGSSALYTYKLVPKKRRYYARYYRG